MYSTYNYEIKTDTSTHVSGRPEKHCPRSGTCDILKSQDELIFVMSNLCAKSWDD